MNAHEFGLQAGFVATPDRLVALSRYRSALAVESARRSLTTGERIPASAVRASIAHELELELEELEMLLYAGDMLVWDRELAAMSDTERAVALLAHEDAAAELAIEPGSVLAELINLAKERAAEVEWLNALLEEEEPEQ